MGGGGSRGKVVGFGEGGASDGGAGDVYRPPRALPCRRSGIDLGVARLTKAVVVPGIRRGYRDDRCGDRVRNGAASKWEVGRDKSSDTGQSHSIALSFRLAGRKSHPSIPEMKVQTNERRCSKRRELPVVDSAGGGVGAGGQQKFVSVRGQGENWHQRAERPSHIGRVSLNGKRGREGDPAQGLASYWPWAGGDIAQATGVSSRFPVDGHG